MSRTSLFAGALVLSGAALWACATAAVIDTNTDLPEAGTEVDSGGGGKEGGVVGDAGCPQFDLNTDPKHCGSCTKACASTEVCSAGACKAECTSPTVKCASDAGGSCVDTSKDPNHCGGCTTACKTVDPGSLPTDNGNPDSGIPTPDGGYDAGLLPATGTPTCDGGACGINCPPLTALCSDSVCYDTKDNHDHCGDCNTACAANTEWCTAGKCCPVGQEVCNGVCVSVLGDKNNCGACGNVCPGQQVCSNGACTSSQPCSVVATAYCTGKGWTVASWGTAYPNQPGGAIYCVKGVSAAADCDTCGTYNELVWKSVAKDACNSGQALVAGQAYGGHSPCTCAPNLLSCGSWPMNNCTPD